MKKLSVTLPSLLCLLFFLSGCSTIGEKTASLSLIYGATTCFALLLIVGYCCLIRKKNSWLLLLFVCVAVVNGGYLALSLSKTLEEALLANRIAYLGSVFLPVSMLMTIRDICKLPRRLWLSILLLVLGLSVFLLAASPGYLDIYYKEVSLSLTPQGTVLEKVYGPWHRVYLFYLLFGFAAMLGTILFSMGRKRHFSTAHACILLAAVSANIGVWLLGQLVRVDFEFLSVSYIISELFLLSLDWFIQERASEDGKESIQTAPPQQPLPAQAEAPVQTLSSDLDSIPAEKDASRRFSLLCAYVQEQLPRLTPTERTVLALYLQGKSTKEVLAELNIKENTLKYHNKNLYSKLGVSSRRELIKVAEALELTL